MTPFLLWKRQCKREWLLQRRQVRASLNASVFFLMMLIFIPLSMPADPVLLRLMVPGLIWVAMLLALFLASERLFQQDFDDGVIEQWAVSGYPMSTFVSAKLIIHWLATLLPMLFLCPVLGVIFSLNVYETSLLAIILLAGTPGIFSLCGLASAFGLGLQQRGMLMALILIPLAIPIMIFGSAAMTAVMEGNAISGHLALLCALSLIGVGGMPFAMGGVIRASA